MADEIFVNTGTSFQQQYTARQPAIGTAPAIGTVVAQAIAASQTPFTYQNRTPSIYQNQVNAQTPSIGNDRQPSTYARQGRLPSTYQNRQPFTYPRIAQVVYQHPFTYSNRQPGTYPRIAQATYPYIAQARQPTIYQHPTITRSPSSYQARQPSTYPRTAQATYPYIANGQTTLNNQNTSQMQTPYPANAQGRTPANVQSNVQTSTPARTPSIGNVQSTTTGQQTYPYIANATGTHNVIYPDATLIDATLTSWGSQSGYDGESAFAQAYVQVEVFYNTVGNGGRLEVLASEFGTGGTNSSNRRVYWFSSDHDVSIGGYTVKYTQDTVTEDDGTFQISTLGSSATTIPTGGLGNGVKLKYRTNAEADPGSEEDTYGLFNINLIFEHATLPTYTYTAYWNIHASADSDG